MYLFKYFELIKHLTLREIKARYKQSFFGFLWIVINPFFQMLIMSFVFSQILRVNNIGVPYPIFLYVGLLPWTLFSSSVMSASSALVDNASLVKKIYFPREVLVLSTLLAKMVDFGIASIILILMFVFFHTPLTWHALLVIPIFLLQFLFTLGLSLFLSVMNLLYRDIQYLFNLILTLWFYLTPIVYTVEYFPTQYRWIFKFNPMAVFINAYRQVLLNGDIFSLSSMAIGVIVSLVIFIFSYILFKKLEGVVADVV